MNSSPTAHVAPRFTALTLLQLIIQDGYLSETNVGRAQEMFGRLGRAMEGDRSAPHPTDEREMAECMDMVRQELICAGVIPGTVPPMMVADAVLGHIAGLKAGAISAGGGESDANLATWPEYIYLSRDGSAVSALEIYSRDGSEIQWREDPHGQFDVGYMRTDLVALAMQSTGPHPPRVTLEMWRSLHEAQKVALKSNEAIETRLSRYGLDRVAAGAADALNRAAAACRSKIVDAPDTEDPDTAAFNRGVSACTRAVEDLQSQNGPANLAQELVRYEPYDGDNGFELRVDVTGDYVKLADLPRAWLVPACWRSFIRKVAAIRPVAQVPSVLRAAVMSLQDEAVRLLDDTSAAAEGDQLSGISGEVADSHGAWQDEEQMDDRRRERAHMESLAQEDHMALWARTPLDMRPDPYKKSPVGAVVEYLRSSGSSLMDTPIPREELGLAIAALERIGHPAAVGASTGDIDTRLNA
jgi:hypothetical protein